MFQLNIILSTLVSKLCKLDFITSREYTARARIYSGIGPIGMSRSVTWRRTCSDAVSWRQDQANNATIYILREFGPTGYLLKEEGETKKFKVFLGDRHQCTCPIFTKEKDLCKHICWILLKKFRVPRDNPVTWQLGLVEREVNEILRGILTRCDACPPSKNREESMAEKTTGIEQRVIADGDVCPICQEDFLQKHQPVTFCRYGCGNSVHIRCMKVWADHQKSSGNLAIRCPMCRQDFGPISLLQQEFRNASVRPTGGVLIDKPAEHLGVSCRQCHVCPISGKCYKCATCAEYHLCERCFDCRTHTGHSFLFRKKISQRWRPVAGRPAVAVVPSSGADVILPTAVVSDLMSREIGQDDYEMLLQLDNPPEEGVGNLSASSVHSLPCRRVRASDRLLCPGKQCRVCLRPYHVGDSVRALPCRHCFHADCIERWLLQQRPACPIDGTVYNDETCRLIREAAQLRRRQGTGDGDAGGGGSREQRSAPPSEISLEVPGIGLSRRASTASTATMRGRGRLHGNRATITTTTTTPVDVALMTEGLSLGVNSSECGIRDNLFSLQQAQVSSAQSNGERNVAPSIPLPHNVTMGDVLAQCNIHNSQGGSQASQQLPPTSMVQHCRRQVGRQTSKRVLNTRSAGQETSQPLTVNENDIKSTPDDLYVGNGPISSTGLTIQRIVSSEVRGHMKRSSLVPRGPQELSQHRWGAVRDVDGNEMSLAGTAVDNISHLKRRL